MRTRKPLRALLAAALLGSILQFGFQSAPPEQADPPAGVEPAPAEQVEQVDPQPELQPAPVEPVEARPLVEATINRVIDGDTLDAQIDGIRTPVGYLGAETPLPNQTCGPEAFARNLELARDHVLLQADTSFSGLDPRRRQLFYAYTLDGISIDETLVYEGLARAPRVDSAHGATLANLESDARANARGCLWAQ